MPPRMFLFLAILLPSIGVADEDWHQIGQTIQDSVEDSRFYRNNDIDAEGNTIVVYYSGEPDLTPGVARVSDLIGGNWVLRGSPIVTPTNGGHTFDGIALSGDGNTVAITGGAPRGGNISVFTWDVSSQVWTPLGQVITDPDASADLMGETVDLDYSGTVIGFTRRWALSGRGGNTVMTFVEATNSWVQKGQIIRAEHPGEDLQFIRLADDGNDLIAGNCGYQGVRGATNLRVFRWSSASSEWVIRGREFTTTGLNGGCYGTLSDDGNVLAINFEGDDTAGEDAGKVAIYQWDETAQDWSLKGDSIYGEKPGEQIAGFLSANGERVAVFTKGQAGSIRAHEWRADIQSWSPVGSTIAIEYEADWCCWVSTNRAGDVLVNTTGIYDSWDLGTETRVFAFTTIDSIGVLAAETESVGANRHRATNLTDLISDGTQNLATYWRNNGNASTAWFTLDLGSEHSVYELKIAPRGDTGYGLAITVGNELSGGKVSGGIPTSCQTWGIDSATPTYLQSCYLSASGRYVTVQGKGNGLRVHGVEVYGEPPGNLNPQPTAQYSFEVDPDTLTVDFDASASSDPNGSVVKYEWDFGDGSTGAGMTVSHQYASEGQYRVTLTVMDDGGVKAAVSKRPSVYSSGLTYLGATALAAGANDSTRARIVDRLGTFQRLETSWVNDGIASSAWFTLDLGSSRSVGELRIAPRADRSYNLEVTISDSLSGGKASAPVAGYCVTTAGSAPVPTELQSCQVSGQGRYMTVRESSRKWLTFHGIEVLGTP